MLEAQGVLDWNSQTFWQTGESKCTKAETHVLHPASARNLRPCQFRHAWHKFSVAAVTTTQTQAIAGWQIAHLTLLSSKIFVAGKSLGTSRNLCKSLDIQDCGVGLVARIEWAAAPWPTCDQHESRHIRTIGISSLLSCQSCLGPEASMLKPPLPSTTLTHSHGLRR